MFCGVVTVFTGSVLGLLSWGVSRSGRAGVAAAIGQGVAVGGGDDGGVTLVVEGQRGSVHGLLPFIVWPS